MLLPTRTEMRETPYTRAVSSAIARTSATACSSAGVRLTQPAGTSVATSHTNTVRGRHERRADGRESLDERRHVDDEITQQRKVIERAHLDGAGPERRQARAARPALAAVDDHGARATHADAARVAQGQRRVLLALDGHEGVEHGGVGDGLDVIRTDLLALAGRPAEHLE